MSASAQAAVVSDRPRRLPRTTLRPWKISASVPDRPWPSDRPNVLDSYIPNMEYYSQVTETFAALADRNRLRMLELLRSRPRTVNEICVCLRLNQPHVSKHLRVLKEAGLVDVEPRAQERVYQLRGGSLRELRNWLDRYRELWDARFDALDTLVDELKKKEKQHARNKRT